MLTVMFSRLYELYNRNLLDFFRNKLPRSMVGKTCFPTALQQLNGMQGKNSFPSHSSLPRQSPLVSPTPSKEKKKEEKKGEILSLKTGGSPTRTPGTALGWRRQARGL